MNPFHKNPSLRLRISHLKRILFSKLVLVSFQNNYPHSISLPFGTLQHPFLSSWTTGRKAGDGISHAKREKALTTYQLAMWVFSHLGREWLLHACILRVTMGGMVCQHNGGIPDAWLWLGKWEKPHELGPHVRQAEVHVQMDCFPGHFAKQTSESMSTPFYK